ncbi:MAG: hypothetical protein COW01_11730 [Bdellovibrionales bacterium CG12_big_fil_rev_8_21_14_0_65_38_15]|nr:MAG: hypothetical protein COW79_11760 [Bdellovibrionales bacterium CG22_combo_CG10-13_8_21_14_all_38_13]PIQ54282.1 MAG: hypothetical protein COW01_11730 [Bdellovibrionales bacterium CG12_big_fil_rev_8_21_14_0_65_38_15]PIR29338.1 MAG: hypothetical protein COV38_11375 [Bdellovibrionales bacterium CG11_big_fil_rev_8_21_14_0_20_38_13]
MKFFKSILFFIVFSTSTFASNPVDMGSECGFALNKIPFSKQEALTSNTMELARDAFIQCLSSYLTIETVSPKGDEHLAVDFLFEAIKVLGWPVKRFETPNLVEGLTRPRSNLIATLPANGAAEYDWSELPKARSVLLNHHMDVVGVIPEQWESPDLTFSGKVAPSIDYPNKQYIWGRGALDMKGIGMLQLVSMVIIERLGWPRNKDIHFLAVSDEEQASSGAIGTVQAMAKGQSLHALTKAALMLNESGGASMDLPKDGVNLHLIGVEEKGAAWMKLKDKDPMTLLSNLAKLRTLDIYKQIKEDKGSFKRSDCSLIKLVTPGSKVNVVASKLEFTIDCSDSVSEDFFKSVFTDGFDAITFEQTSLQNEHKIVLATKSSSHGSIGLSQSVLEVFAVGVHRLGFVELPSKQPKKADFYKETQTNVIKKFIKNLGSVNIPISILRRLQWIPFMKRFMLRQVANAFDIDGLFRTTCQFTALNSDQDSAEALLDCRLLHTAKGPDSIEGFFKDVKSFIGNENLVIEPIIGWNVSSSPIQGEEYDIIVSTLNKLDPKALVTPYLFPAGTDNKFFRDPVTAGEPSVLPIPSYGFFPVFLDSEMVASMHGSNEKFPLDQIAPGLFKYSHVLRELIAKE